MTKNNCLHTPPDNRLAPWKWLLECLQCQHKQMNKQVRTLAVGVVLTEAGGSPGGKAR